MNPPRSAFGASPPGGHRQRPGQAGSAAVAGLSLVHAPRRSLLRVACAAPLGLALPAAAGAAETAGAAQPAYQWRSLPFGGGGFVDGFVFHPRQRGLLYARTDIGGAYRFDGAARAWVPLLDHLSRADADLMGVLSLAVDAQDADRLYLACGLYTGEWARKAALLASRDRGASWQTHELGFKLGGNEPGRGSGERLQVDPQHGARLWLGSSQDGLWRSDDHGQHFSRVADFAPAHVSLVLIDPRGGRPGMPSNTLWVGSHDQPGLWFSQDGGQRFERVAALPAQAPQRAAIGPDGALYVSLAQGDGSAASNPGNARSGSVWRRDPDGRWTDITPLRPGAGEGRGFGYAGLDVDAQRPGRLVVATIERWSEGEELFVSEDGGRHWTALAARSRNEPGDHAWLASYQRGQQRLGHWIADCKLDPFDGQRAVYGTGYGLWLTERLDAQPLRWEFAVANLEETATLGLVSPSGGATLLAAMGDVAGAAWDQLAHTPKHGLFAPCHDTNRGVASAAQAPAIVVRTADQAPTGGYASSDGGASWRPFGSAPWAGSPRANDRPLAGPVAVSARGGFIVTVPEGRAAMCSRDRGRSWAACAGWPTGEGQARRVPVADPQVEGVFYVHEPAAGRILVSVDGGVSFAPAVTGLPKVAHWQSAQLVCAPGKLRDLWLALPQGLVHLAGVDEPARPCRDVLEAWQVALGQAAPGAAYHSVYVWGRVRVDGSTDDTGVAGLFRSDDAGARFQRIDDDRHRYGRLLALAADPLAHGTVYLAPHGRGVIVGRPRSSATPTAPGSAPKAG